MSVIAAWARRVFVSVEDEVVDEFLELLLKVMHGLAVLSPDYRSNIDGFRGKYLFRTSDDRVVATVLFADRTITVGEHECSDWDARVTFRDAGSLMRFLFSKNQDIVASVLENAVEVDGNFNYVFRFAYLAREARRRLLPHAAS